MSKAYLKFSGHEYYGYNVFGAQYIKDTNYKVTGIKLKPDYFDKKIIITTSLANSLAECKTPIPTKGSKLYLCGKNPYAVADIKKNYTVVRTPDKADYVVTAPIKNKNYNYRTIVVFQDINTVMILDWFGFNEQAALKNAARKALADMFEEKQLESCEAYWDGIYVLNEKDEEMPIRGFLGLDNISNKMAFYSSLDMRSADDVTLDSLKILNGTFLGKSWSIQEEENAKIILMTFHNLNYRDIPGTMSRVFRVLYRNSRLFREMEFHKSRFPKPIKDLFDSYRIQLSNHIFSDEHDYNLCYDYMESLMNVGDSRTVSYRHYKDKLSDSYLDEYQFEEIYNVKVRITPKTYEDYISAKQNGNSAC